MKRVSPTQARLLRWLSAGGTINDRWGYPLAQPPIGAPPFHQRTMESLCRKGLIVWETHSYATGVGTYRECRITDAGRAVLEQAEPDT